MDWGCWGQKNEEIVMGKHWRRKVLDSLGGSFFSPWQNLITKLKRVPPHGMDDIIY